MDENKLRNNIDYIKEQIQMNNKNEQAVNMIAVTKYTNSETIRTLYNLGLRDFAENRSDDLIQKQDELKDINDKINWHFIGNLQTRPVRKIINRITALHSLDRLSLIKEVNKRADQQVEAFLQVNISGEKQKSGFKPEEVLSIIETIKDYSMIKIVGLMQMAPYDANEEKLQDYFNQLKLLQEEIKALNLSYAPCDRLSMGMTRDYKIAVQEGATDVRIGRALFDEA